MLGVRPRWWIIGPGTHWQQWALIERGGRVAIYDGRGRTILRARYPNRFKAAAALRRRGFRRLRRGEGLTPPMIQRD